MCRSFHKTFKCDDLSSLKSAKIYTHLHIITNQMLRELYESPIKLHACKSEEAAVQIQVILVRTKANYN